MTFAQEAWRKSSYSDGAGGECVEVARAADVVGVRDSKNAAGPALVLGPSSWDAFRRTVQGASPSVR